jgi:hypothetical protein
VGPEGSGLETGRTGHSARVSEPEVVAQPEQVSGELDTLAEIRSRAGSDTSIRSFYEEICQRESEILRDEADVFSGLRRVVTRP